MWSSGTDRLRRRNESVCYQLWISHRTSDANRRTLALWCAERKIRLVLVHLSYRDSVRHECVLTEFALEYGVLIFEAFALFHPDEVGVAEMFADSWHPTAAGQEALAQGLSEFFIHGLLAGGSSQGGTPRSL